MPTSIATAIARQIGADPAETERVLDHLVQDVRHEVARNGACAVPGLGTFRLFEGTIAFEPERGLAMAVNHRYAGLEALLVNAADLPAPEKRSPIVEEPPSDTAGFGVAGGADAPQGIDHVSHEEAPPTYELPEWSAIPPPDWAPEDSEAWQAPPAQEELSGDEIGRQDTPPAEPAYEAPPPAFERADFHELDETPASTAYTDVPFVPDWSTPPAEPTPVWEEPDATAEPEAPQAAAEHEEAPAEWSPADAFSRLEQYEPEPEPPPQPEPEPYTFEQYAPERFEPLPDEAEDASVQDEEAAFQLPPEREAEPAESEFYQLWGAGHEREQDAFEPSIPAEPEAEPYQLQGFGTPPQPEETFSLPPSPWTQAEDQPDQPTGIDEQAAVYSDRDENPPAPPVEIIPAPVIPGATALPLGAKAIVVEQPTPPPATDGPARKKSGVPWLVAAVALIAVAAAVWLLNRPGVDTAPVDGEQIAVNEAPADPEPEVPTDSTAQVQTPAIAPPPPVQEAPAAPGDTSPLRRSGGIDAAAGGFTLVVASVPSRTTADAVAQRYRDEGFTTAIFYGALGGVTRYRVGVGQFADDRALETQLNDLPDAFPQDAWPMAIQEDMEVYQ